MIRYLTAGESHGQALVGVIEGLPANMQIDIDALNQELYRRQQGYGRGGRMGIEQDKVEILSGVRFGRTLGSPISFILRNRDWKNWLDEMNPLEGKSKQPVTRPRPGHADLSGVLKYGFDDIRDVLERSSARETAVRVAVGAFVKQFLAVFGVRIFSHILQIGQVKVDINSIKEVLAGDEINRLADQSPVRCLDAATSEKMVQFIRRTKQQGDTAGGIIQIIIRGLPPGLGTYVHWDRKLDAQLAYTLMSIQAVKGVEIGVGFNAADKTGSQFQDEIFYENGRYFRKTNNAGGIEGGMSTGDDIVIQVMKKPIPTLMKPLRSVDMKTKEPFLAHKERSDVTAVPACSVITEAVVAPVIANALIDKFGGDTMDDILTTYQNYLGRIKQ